MGRNPNFPGTVRTVVFMLSVLAVIVALHLLQREKERYRSEGGMVFAYGVIVSLALAVGGYPLLYVSSRSPLGRLLDRLLGGLGILYLLGMLAAALVAVLALLGLAAITLNLGVVPRWGGVALLTGNPLWAVIPIGFYYDTPYFSIVIWILAGSWIVVGCAVFLAAGRRTERPSRVR